MIKLPIDFKANKKQTIIFIALTSAILLFLYVTFLLKPQIVNAVQAMGEVSRIGFELGSAQADVAKIAKYKNDIELHRQKINSYEDMLPIEQEIPALLEELSGMAKASNVKIVEIVPVVSKESNAPRPNQIYREIPILISAKCGYNDLGSFISRLESANRFMKVADLHIKANKDNPKKHDVELMVLTYILLKGK